MKKVQPKGIRMNWEPIINNKKPIDLTNIKSYNVLINVDIKQKYNKIIK